MPRVTILTLNYNSSAYTIQCLQSVRQHTAGTIDYQVVVVDNNSEDEQWEQLKALQGFDRVTVIASKINLGFAGGLMYGLQFAAPSEYVVFLNNDAVFENDCLGELLEFMDAHPNVGLCTPQMYDDNGKIIPSFDYFQSLQKLLLGPGILRWFNPSKYITRNKIYTEPITVGAVSGSFMFVRTSAFSAIGGLDTRYFLYCEEEDLSRRMHLAGWEVFLVPMARFTHFASRSITNGLAILREVYISLHYYQQKFYSFPVRFLVRLLTTLKVAKRFYRSWDWMRLAWFYMKGACPAESLRYKQTINTLRQENKKFNSTA